MSTSSEPFLVFRRTGRTIAAVLAFGFGGGTVLLGVLSVAGTLSAAAVLGALRGYFLAALPFFAGAAVLAACKRELWFVPESRAFRMLTYRPWLRAPRVEQAPIEEYRALRTERAEHAAEQATVIVSLVTEAGEAVPIRELDEPGEARAFAEQLAAVTGLPLAADA